MLGLKKKKKFGSDAPEPLHILSKALLLDIYNTWNSIRDYLMGLFGGINQINLVEH